MITLLTALLAAATPAAAPAQTSTAPLGIVETSNGKPARHRITIVSAFSCPYCRVFDQQGMDELRRYWMPRGLSVETVLFIISPTDVPASIAATCGPMQGYARRSTILFRAQSDILGNWATAPDAQKDKATAIPHGGGAPAIARLSGLLALAPSLGLTTQQLSACLADPARQKIPGQRLRAAVARWNIAGTPTVLIDGKRVPGTWSDIRKVLVTTMAS